MLQTLRQWWHQRDHFYGITAILAARRIQGFTCRLLATLIVALGVPPVMMIWSPAGPHGTAAKAVPVITALCALALAVWWLRGRWPSRTQSLTFAALVVVGITATALTRSDPISAILPAATFAALAGYLVFFHSARYLFFLFIAAVPAVFIPFARLVAAGDAASACSLLVMITVITVAVAFVSKALVHLIGVAGAETEIEPVTGLRNRAAFYDATGSLIASRSRRDDRYLVIIVVNLDNYNLLTTTARAAQARISAGQALRETTRRDAVVGHISDSEFLVADSFLSDDSTALVERIRSAIKSTPLRMTTSIGVVSTPMAELASCPPHDLLDELVALATTAMYQARRTGGNQAHYVVCARPSALDDYPDQAEDAC